MSNFQDKYKQNRGGANDAATGRMIRARQQEERRRDNRAAHFSRYRDVSADPETQVPETRATPSLDVRLRRWKFEKELKKKMEQKNKKPIFKVGVVHHNFYSPVAKDGLNTPCHSRGVHRPKTKPSPAKRITRATQKRLEAKMAAAASVASPHPAASTVATCATPAQPRTSVTRPSTQKKAIPSAKKVPQVSFAPQTYAFKGPVGVKKMPMFGRFAVSRDSLSESAHSSEKSWPANSHISASESQLKNSLVRENAPGRLSLKTSKHVSLSKDSLVKENSMKISESDVQTDADASKPVENADSPVVETLQCPDWPSPAMFSPYVTTSRGKDSARRERRSRMGIGRTPPDEVPTKETIMRSLNISVEEEERTAQYFKFILQREVERLNEICAKWEKVKGEPGVPEDARYLMNQAIGQTTLLVRKKLERFRSLVADCETGKGEMLVQCRDLQGFWDMTYVEVKNCDSRFQKLEQLRSRGWVEDEIIVTKRPTGTRKKVAANKFTANVKSSARSWILAKRKMMSQTEENDGDVVAAGHDSEDPVVSSSTDRNSPRTVPRSAKRASPKITPKKTPASLLKKVQLSETKKNPRSPLTVMKISQMCKTPDVRLDETISYVNSDQIPGRGILKKSDETSTTDVAAAKFARKVDFDDDVSNEHRTDENLENSIDLGRALARIDSYESDSSDDVFQPNDLSRANVTLRRIEKRLDFENESISETENTDTAESSTIAAAIPESFAFPPLAVTALSPARSASTSEAHPSMTTKAPRRSTRIAELPKEEGHSEDESSTRRVLRNITVSTNTPKKNPRRSIKSPSARKTFIEHDSSIKENDDPQIPVRQKSLSESSKVSDIESHSGEPNKLRRSMRKSVRFNDVLGSAKGWAASLLFHPTLRKQLKHFFNREDTFSLGVCNGCQLMSLLGWIGGDLNNRDKGTDDRRVNIVLDHNKSERFECRWTTVKITKTPAIMLQGMENSVMGV